MARSDPKLDLLRSIPLFNRAKPREIERIGQLADEVEMPAGRVLMRQGDRGAEMFILVSGAGTVERDGREIDRIGPGAWVGELALLAEGPRMATITLTEPSRLLVIGHREFHTLLGESPAIRTCVLDELATRLRKLEPPTTA
ncbi:MAG: cyclic nucleotide-binding domain-containing protein [Chloroflexi bacterium]|nr:cyclic nucleotide-binding domain-containing protein [Chloroflexota bacterium]